MMTIWFYCLRLVFFWSKCPNFFFNTMIFFTILVILAQFSKVHNGHFKMYFWLLLWLSSVQSLSHVWRFVTPFCSMPGFPVHHQLPESTQTHAHWVHDPTQPSHPLSSPSPPACNLFQHQGLFQWVSSSHQVAKVLEFQLQNQSFQWNSGLISFRMDWLDLLAVQGTLKSLLQHHSSRAWILQHSAFFMVQLSHPYLITGKTIALTRWTFVGKVMSLLFNMLSRFFIAFLPRSKCLLISWLQSPPAVILEPKKIKSVTVSIVSSSILPWSDGTRCHDPSFLNVEF